jgi:hypothetical protein
MNYELKEYLTFDLESDMDLGDLISMLTRIQISHGDLEGFTLTEITENHGAEKTLFTLNFERVEE